MIFDWYARPTAIGTVHVLCDQHGTSFLKIAPLSRGKFLRLEGMGISATHIVVPAISLESDHDKEQFEQYVLRTVWRTQSDNVLFTIPCLYDMGVDDEMPPEPEWPEALSLPFGDE